MKSVPSYLLLTVDLIFLSDWPGRCPVSVGGGVVVFAPRGKSDM